VEELAKTEARNYLSAAGFFLLAGAFLLGMIIKLDNITYVKLPDQIQFVIGIGLLIIATLLLILRKRDMIALLFILFGFNYLLFAAIEPNDCWYFIIAAFILLVALITLTSKDKKKWLLFLIPVLWFINFMISILQEYTPFVCIPILAILALLCFYYSFCCASERWKMYGKDYLIADEQTDFKASGSVLGYMLFALLTGGYAIYYLVGETVLPLETFVTIEHLCGILMIFVAILLLTVGKMRFTPIMFMLVGLVGILSMYSNGAMFIGLGILMIIIGLFAMLRKESRILPGLMLMIYGCTWFFSMYVQETSISAPIVSALLNGILRGRGGLVVWCMVGVIALAMTGALAAAALVKAFSGTFAGLPRSEKALQAFPEKTGMTVGMGILLIPSLLVPFLAPVLFPDYGILGKNAAFSLMMLILFRGVRSLSRKTEPRQVGTWDCGYAAPDGRMQYTGTGFIRPLGDLFSSFLRFRKHTEPVNGGFPVPAAADAEAEDLALRMIWKPLFCGVTRLAEMTHHFQSGYLHLYILVMLIALAVMLICGIIPWGGLFR